MAAPKNYRGKTMTPLHILLTECFPRRETIANGILNVPWLADKLNVTPEGVYKWIRENRIPVAHARRIVAIRECQHDLAAFLDFLT